MLPESLKKMEFEGHLVLSYLSLLLAPINLWAASHISRSSDDRQVGGLFFYTVKVLSGPTVLSRLLDASGTRVSILKYVSVDRGVAVSSLH